MVQNKKLKEKKKEKNAVDSEHMMNRNKTTKKRKLSMNKKIRDDELLEIENDFYVFSKLENDIDDREA